MDHALLEGDGPSAHGDKLGTPQPDERLLWRGRPNVALLARGAFRTYWVAFYFLVLVAICLATDRPGTAAIMAGAGAVTIAILYVLAWLSARSTLYILTDVRVIMRIGMAIETRINVPLKQVIAAHLRDSGKGFGDIALELSGERLLGVVLLWPHLRPWHINHPQPMLRGIPDVARVAQLLADARALYGEIEHNLSAINDPAPETAQQGPSAVGAQVLRPSTSLRGTLGNAELDGGLEGAPA
ncbi:MAG: photosynthetic complex putative assembly protein PuhB [Erythrobacter sp.]